MSIHEELRYTILLQILLKPLHHLCHSADSVFRFTASLEFVVLAMEEAHAGFYTEVF